MIKSTGFLFFTVSDPKIALQRPHTLTHSHTRIADVAQLVEQLTCNQLVGGSSPSIGS